MKPDVNNVIWLAKRQIREIWLAYPLSFVYFLFMGAILAADTSWAREFGHCIIMLILIQPAISGRYMTWKQDNDIVRHQVFLRGIPVPFITIVWARLAAMLLAGVINVPAYMIPYWFINRTFAGFGAYLGWIVFWVGIALVFTITSLVQEFTLGIRPWTIINLLVIGLFLIFLTVNALTLGYHPVAASIDRANAQPLMVGSIGLVLVIVSLVVGPRLVVRGFRRRELTT